MAKCNNCGRELAENEVCSCTEVQQPQKKNSLIPALIIVAAVLIILTSCCFGFLLFNNRSSTTKSRAFGNAASLYKAANSALTELDEKGCNVGGYFIISSDSENNYNVPDTIDIDEFSKIVNKFYEDSNKREWFAVCKDGCTTYVAQSKKWDTEIVGTYPHETNDNGAIYCYYEKDYAPYNSSQGPKTDKITLKELYDDAAEKVKQG